MISGYTSFNSLKYFVKKYENEIKNHLNLNKLPSPCTVYRAVAYADKLSLEKIIAQTNCSDLVLSIDGKFLAGSVQNAHTQNHSIEAFVSIYSQQKNKVLIQKSFSNHKKSEIHCVQNLLQEVNLSGSIVIADALHTSKKTRELIKEKGGEYILNLKK